MLAARIIGDERGMAERVSERFDAALDASLAAQEVHA
jgi:hypothetical protein